MKTGLAGCVHGKVDPVVWCTVTAGAVHSYNRDIQAHLVLNWKDMRAQHVTSYQSTATTVYELQLHQAA
jgi:hypothetical protein